jgi:hypothetical protein
MRLTYLCVTRWLNAGSFVRDSAAPSGALNKQSQTKWRTLQNSVYFVRNGCIALAVLLWSSVSSGWDLTAEEFHNDRQSRRQ